MSKPILVSGIQPSGRLHIGNYLGALKNFVDLQNSGKYDCYFFIADYHSLTENFNPAEKPAQILNLAADFLAAGLDPKKSKIFIQSAVPQSTELAWILETIAPIGELKRMTQFKDKSGTQQENVNVGLFTYPTLMAADILLYDAQFVPVGEDQLQHLELTRTLARKFNSHFGRTLFEPKEILTATPRVMSLDDPTKKMSKSRPGGCLFIDDEPEVIKSKVRGAVTDSESVVKYDPKHKAGISNMLEIMSGLSGKSINEVEKGFAGMNYGELKHSLADYVADYFEKFRKKKTSLLKKPANIRTALRSGAAKAKKNAERKMIEIKKKIGL
ncbi:MAG: Tryptophan--tRNA ligase [Parcubacteria group bacterium Gr01-1014_19]|nr:MAG: Tryptophan--tRNA ligase [Parcubacteria group bacterium Gr01-1014_19]